MKAFAHVRTALIGASGLVAVACFISTTTRPVAVQKGGPPARLVRVPVKAHLMNGDVVMFRAGVTVGNGIATGMGERFTLTRAQWPSSAAWFTIACTGVTTCRFHVAGPASG